MSAVIKPSRKNRPARPGTPKARPARVSNINDKNRVPNRVQQIPAQDQTPKWLRSLLFAERFSIAITFILAGSALMVYGWTVYAQQLWGKEYQKLDQLRRDERQITTSKEVLKDQIAKQANRPGSTLAPQTPNSMIFLKPAPNRPDAKAPSSTPQASPVAPLGY
jgi:hypothetical protein